MNCRYCNKSFNNKGGLAAHEKACHKIQIISADVMSDYLNKGLSINKLAKKYSIGKSSVVTIIGNKKRTTKEANKLGRELYSENFKHSNETKAKLREIRLEYMRNNPDKTAWRQKNMSYPEKIFKELLENLDYNKKFKIVREYCVFPYFIDFAFVDIKVAIEIDGSQHGNSDVRERDKRKDKLLHKEGWRIIRFHATNVLNKTDEIIKILAETIISNEKYIVYPIEKYISRQARNKIKLDEERRVNGGRTNKQIAMSLSQRKVERPPYEVLLEDIKELGYRGTGRKYGVSDNAIRKWERKYNK